MRIYAILAIWRPVNPEARKWSRKNGDFTSDVARRLFPLLPPSEARLTAFFVPARPSREMWLTASVCSLLWTILARFWGQNEKTSLRAGRPAASVGGGALGMALPAAGRGVDRLGKRRGGRVRPCGRGNRGSLAGCRRRRRGRRFGRGAFSSCRGRSSRG